MPEVAVASPPGHGLGSNTFVSDLSDPPRPARQRVRDIYGDVRKTTHVAHKDGVVGERIRYKAKG